MRDNSNIYKILIKQLQRLFLVKYLEKFELVLSIEERLNTIFFERVDKESENKKNKENRDIWTFTLPWT